MNLSTCLKPIGISLAVALLAFSSACRQSNSGVEQIARDSAKAQQVDSDLSFDDITLEQADEQGRLLWKVSSERATYSQDKQLAEAINPKGELYKDGKPIYRVQGQRGRLQQNGERIFLMGQIVATDLKSGAVLRGNEMEWQPKEGLLIVRNNLTGTHPQLKATAKEAHLSEKDRRLLLLGGVTINTKDPDLELRAERLSWKIDEQRIVSNLPIQIQRFEEGEVVDTATGNRAEVNLKTKVALLQRNAQVTLAQPALKVNGNSLLWNFAQSILKATEPFTVAERQQQIMTTADRGRLELKPQIAYFNGNVHAVGQRNGAQLKSDRLTWNIRTRQLQADGTVNYRQSSPPLNITGPRAVGNLESQNVAVGGGRVRMEIVPQRQ